MKASYKAYRERERKKKTYEIADEVLTEWMTQADIAILYTLHNDFGFGAKRCHDFYVGMVKNHRDMTRFRSGDDDSHYLIMAERLKLDGIDVEALQREVEDL